MKKINNENKAWMVTFAIFLVLSISSILFREYLFFILAVIWLIAGIIMIRMLGYRK